MAAFKKASCYAVPQTVDMVCRLSAVFLQSMFGWVLSRAVLSQPHTCTHVHDRCWLK
jgi:hypothetical protein